MIKIRSAIPRKVVVSVSGGSDSMSLLHFLNQKPERVVYAIHLRYPGRTEEQEEALRATEDLVVKYARSQGVNLIVKHMELGTECSGSIARKDLYSQLAYPVATGHTLDDAMEWWLMRVTKNFSEKRSYFMQDRTELTTGIEVIKPFLFTRKSRIIKYADKHGIPYIDDPTNFDGSNDRSKLRVTNVVTSLETVSPGMAKAFRRRLLEMQS